MFPGNYISYKNDRSDGKGGGVFLLVSNKYESQEPEELKAGKDCKLDPDHEAVFIESSLRTTKKSPSPRRVYKYHRADYEGFKKEFREFARDINEQATEMNSQAIWTSFKTTIHRLMEKYIPHKTGCDVKKPKPWITRTIRALQRKHNKL